MATTNSLSKIDTLISTAYRQPKGKLEEPQAKMSLTIESSGRQYLLYSFDKVVRPSNGGKAIDLQPYFQARESVKSMCDYFLFCWESGKLFVLLIELKHGAESVSTQLASGCLFANYLVGTLNRVEKTTIIPQVRLISIRDYHLTRKGTAMKPIVYDKDKFCTFEGYSFHLLEFLK